MAIERRPVTPKPSECPYQGDRERGYQEYQRKFANLVELERVVTKALHNFHIGPLGDVWKSGPSSAFHSYVRFESAWKDLTKKLQEQGEEIKALLKVIEGKDKEISTLKDRDTLEDDLDKYRNVTVLWGREVGIVSSIERSHGVPRLGITWHCQYNVFPTGVKERKCLLPSHLLESDIRVPSDPELISGIAGYFNHQILSFIPEGDLGRRDGATKYVIELLNHACDFPSKFGLKFYTDDLDHMLKEIQKPMTLGVSSGILRKPVCLLTEETKSGKE